MTFLRSALAIDPVDQAVEAVPIGLRIADVLIGMLVTEVMIDKPVSQDR